VQEEWTWGDWIDISASWERTAPPVHYTAYIIGRGFGAIPERSAPQRDVNLAAMPSIADMALIAKPLPV
jgi:hypothetical protein